MPGLGTALSSNSQTWPGNRAIRCGFWVKLLPLLEGLVYLRSQTAFCKSASQKLWRWALRNIQESGMEGRSWIWNHLSGMVHGLTYILLSWLKEQDSGIHKSFQTAHALSFLSANNFWAETMFSNEGNLGEHIKSFKNSIPMVDLSEQQQQQQQNLWLCRVFNVLFLFDPSRSNCHGKWKSHHLLTLTGSYPAAFPEDMLHQNAQDLP